ncbi:MAG: isocyanide synthase family protein [Actinophytocola sp.]|uniref:L-tyrosine/L-tryptophan isonitrile synthase family protein n=1 Tax=Actinophytocola sp. TaxID=1872138 RepID=UPI003C73E7ED
MRTAPPLSTDDTVRQLLQLIFEFRRTDDTAGPCAERPCETCFAVHRDKVRDFVVAGRPVHFVLPAFPAKSRNPNKVLGTLPDLGEHLAIGFLESFCDQLSHVYPPGARITICSDGHVFSDVLGIPDDDVLEYRTELRRMIRATGGGSVDIYSLDDAFRSASFADMRDTLLLKYAQSIDEIRMQVKELPARRGLFNGIHRFMVEDQTALRPELSRTKLRTHCKEMAYQVIQRSNAWGELIGDVFPASLRLSIHPQERHGQKIGFHMIRTTDSWLTPWHGVVVDDGHRFTLVKRSDAENMRASLIWRNSRPSHFVRPAATEMTELQGKAA